MAGQQWWGDRRRDLQNWFLTGVLHSGNETVTPPRQGFDVAGLVGRVPQHLAKSVHGGVESMIEIDECAALPKLLLKFIPSDDLTGPPYESRQNLQRLSLKPQTNPVLAQFARRLIECKWFEY